MRRDFFPYVCRMNTVVFDFAGVISPFTMQRAHEAFNRLGVDIGDMIGTASQSGIFGDLEGGRTDKTGFISELSRLSGRAISMDDCRKAWVSIFDRPLPQTLDCLSLLHSDGFRLAVLSNTNPFITEWMMSPDFDGCGHALSEYADSFYLSWQLKMKKPSRKMFEAMLEGEKASPADVLYIDDSPVNIQAARELGLNTFLAENGKDWTPSVLDILQVKKAGTISPKPLKQF